VVQASVSVPRSERLTFMSVRKLNVLRCELDESLDRAGFRHAAASIGQRVGAERLGAAVYEAEAGHPIWPYHYHYATEEWTYVISGAPVLRDAGGQRVLRSGDLVCFPPGHRGAHTINGPGRFIVFSTDAPGPYAAVYPDSDKIAVAPGAAELNALTLPRAAAVDYWYGEGSEAPSDPVEVVREPAAPSLPVVNALAVPVGVRSTDAPAGFRSRTATLASALGARRLDATVLELDVGEGSAEYHYDYGREEWVLVLAGTPTLRHPEGEDVLHAGELVCFPEGPAGAHRLINRDDRVVRAVFLSTTGLPANVCYPDSGRWLMRNGPDREDLILREAEAVADFDERPGGSTPMER
jgi:uncharacterized cupin superfamily protein